MDVPESLTESAASSDDISISGAASVSLSDSAASADSLTDTMDSAATLSDSVASSDSVDASAAGTASYTDSISSSDDLLVYVFLADVITTDDVFAISFPVSLDDTIESSDTFNIPNPLSDLIASADEFAVQTAFPFSLSDTVVSSDYYSSILNIGSILECGPIPLFPDLPQGFPLKLSIVMDTTIGSVKSLREIRYPQQTYPVWDIELKFEELRDQTQNQTKYSPFAGLYTDYSQLVQLWLMMYGRAGVFAFDAPWDDTRTDQPIATGDGSTKDFEVFRTWGAGFFPSSAPVGMIHTITNVKINGVIQGTSTYSHTRDYISFTSAPANGASITMTFSFWYVCHFVEDEQDFEEFAKNRWAVQSLKFRAAYWPGCVPA